MKKAQREGETHGGGMRMCKEQLKKIGNPLNYGRGQKMRIGK